VETVLGLSIAPTTARLVLVEGRGGDGVTIDHDAFEFHPGDADAAAVSEQVIAAVLGTEAIAAAGDHRLHSIGVTWSDGAEHHAGHVLDALRDLGFGNVVPVRLTEATEALARAIEHVIGYEKTAVCAIEPQEVALSVVDPQVEDVRTAANNQLDNWDGLRRWLIAIFKRTGGPPHRLIVVGSDKGLDMVISQLESAFALPVFALDDADSALARGAALASAPAVGMTSPELADQPTSSSMSSEFVPGIGRLVEVGGARRRWPLNSLGALTMLIVGVLMFVVSLSLAVSLKLVPDKHSEAAAPRRLANDVSAAPAASPPPSPRSPQLVLPPAAPPAAPPPAPAAPAESVPSVEPMATLPTPAPEVYSEIPAPAPPAGAPVAPPQQPAAQPPAAPPAIDTVPPPAIEPPQQEPRLRDRILSRLPFFHRNQQGEQAPQQDAPPPVPPDNPPPPPPP
jgi:hypothetical protein